jgi:hypothetical protein
MFTDTQLQTPLLYFHVSRILPSSLSLCNATANAVHAALLFSVFINFNSGGSFSSCWIILFFHGISCSEKWVSMELLSINVHLREDV